MNSVSFKNIDEYLATVPEKERHALEALRQTIKMTVPEGEEVISYMMPAINYKGMLVYFAAFKNHCTFFVGNGSLIATMKEELKDFSYTKSGIHFTPDKPLPLSLVQKVLWRRMEENEDKFAKKKTVSKK